VRRITQAEERASQTPMTPSKLVTRKSLGLGHGGGDTQATEEKQPVGKYPGLGLVLGRRVDSDDKEDYGNQQQRTRRKSFSTLLLNRDKPKDREDHETPIKEGSRGFMGSVRRISLVVKHKRAWSGGGFVVPLPGPSIGGFFNRSSSGVVSSSSGKRAVPPHCRILSRPSQIRAV
jgi:hypothetical protein